MTTTERRNITDDIETIKALEEDINTLETLNKRLRNVNVNSMNDMLKLAMEIGPFGSREDFNTFMEDPNTVIRL